MRATLPYPPSVNNYLRFSPKGFAYITTQAKQYKQVAKLQALAQGMRPISEGEVSLTIKVFRPAKRGDIDNVLKVLLDSLNGVAYNDDKQIGELCISRFEDKENPRVEIFVTPRRALDGSK